MGLLSILLQPLHDVFSSVATVALFLMVGIPSLTLSLITKGPRSLNTCGASQLKTLLTSRGVLLILTQTPARHLLSSKGAYNAMNGWPCGKWLYTRVVGFFAPYSGSCGAQIVSLVPGTCEMTMSDRPWKRNPFGSIHAVCMANLAEMTAGLAGMTAMEAKGAIGIPMNMHINFHVKARGTLGCRATLPKAIPSVPGIYPMDIRCDIFDEAGTVCASAIVGWSFKVREEKPKSS